jgi:spoIIIJ-associated protein
MPEDDAPPVDEEILVEAAREYVCQLLGHMGIEPAEIEVLRQEGVPVINAICGDDDRIAIGRLGKTLESIQLLLGQALRRRFGQPSPIIVDISGYRHRHRLNLISLARRSADRAQETGTPVQQGPFTAYERQIIHATIREHPKVLTESLGDGDLKQIVFKLRHPVIEATDSRESG